MKTGEEDKICYKKVNIHPAKITLYHLIYKVGFYWKLCLIEAFNGLVVIIVVRPLVACTIPRPFQTLSLFVPVVVVEEGADVVEGRERDFVTCFLLSVWSTKVQS